MKYFIKVLALTVLAVIAAVVNINWLIPGQALIPVELVLLGALSLVVYRQTAEAIIFALIGGGTIDYFSGWLIPGHTLIYIAAVGIFLLLSRRVFSSQTSLSLMANAIIVVIISLLLTSIFAGIDFIAYSEQVISFNHWLAMIWRALLVGVGIGFLQMIRRRNYIKVTIRNQ